MRVLQAQQNKQLHYGLYRIVFESVFVKFSISILFMAFFLQPIAPAYANEIVNSAPQEEVQQEETSVVVEPVSEPEPEPVQDVVEEIVEDEEVAIEEDVSPEQQEETDLAEVVENVEADVEIDEIIPEDDIETIDATTTDDVLPEEQEIVATSSTDTDIEENVSTSTEETPNSGGGSSSTNEEPVDAVDTQASSTEPVITDSSTTTSTTTIEETYSPESSEADFVTDTETPAITEDEFTTTEEEAAAAEISSSTVEQITIPEPSVHYSNANKYQFADQDCVSVGDGSYYCSDKSTFTTAPNADNLYVETDSDGDKEIFMKIDNEILQITDNTYEDDSPYYDAVSESIVWHRLISGRYEIVSYSFDTKEEEVLTDNSINDMEPSRAGEYTVWQQWINDNWEIVLFDGNEEKQITENEYHDVAPHIKSGYVIWHTNSSSGEREVSVYEISTGLTSRIADSEGGQVENPRFVLVYDTTFDNGDVVTKGYDFESGEVVPLSAIPAKIPTEIPSSESTGETRALIQNKSISTKEEVIDVDPVASGDDPNATSTEASSLQDISIELSEQNEEATSTLNMQEVQDEESLQLTEFDVIVEPYIVSSSTQEVGSASVENSL